MAVDLASRSVVSSPVCGPISLVPATELPEDLAGTRFLHSIGFALLAATWGAWLGAMVESAVQTNADARIGALIGAAALALCAAILAFYGYAKDGIIETVGRVLLDAITLAWQGAWLGALVGGGLTAANGGAWVIPTAIAAIVIGALVGAGVGARLFSKNLAKILNSMVWGGVLGGFAASFLWTPLPVLSLAGSVPEAASPIFGPRADWAWRTAGAAPLMLAAFVWWLRWMREEQAKDKEQAVGWGMGAAAFVFVAAMAAGAGAIVGGFAQWLCIYLAAHVTLPPTPGTWLGALLALFFWGLSRQPIDSRSHLGGDLKESATLPR